MQSLPIHWSDNYENVGRSVLALARFSVSLGASSFTTDENLIRRKERDGKRPGAGLADKFVLENEDLGLGQLEAWSANPKKSSEDAFAACEYLPLSGKPSSA